MTRGDGYERNKICQFWAEHSDLGYERNIVIHNCLLFLSVLCVQKEFGDVRTCQKHLREPTNTMVCSETPGRAGIVTKNLTKVHNENQHFPRIFDTEIAAKRVYQAYKSLGIAPKMFLYLFRENWYKRIFTKKYLRDTF